MNSDLRVERHFRLLAEPPFVVRFPSVTYRVHIKPVNGAPVGWLVAEATTGRPCWHLCHAGLASTGDPMRLLKRDLYERGFAVMHPTACSLIMDRLCATGHAQSLPHTPPAPKPPLG